MTSSDAHSSTRRKRWLSAMLIAAGVMALLLPFLFQSRPTVTLKSGGREYKLEVVATPESRQKGLSGRPDMPDDRGMIFVFDEPAVQCIWMKDMRFSLDIAWLDGEKRITHIEQAVSPDTYPRQFCPSEPARYVVELNAGEAERAGLKAGQTLAL